MKKTPSPLLSKILRRQKIYVQTNFPLKTVDNSQDSDVMLSKRPLIDKDEFFSYSDLYIKHKKMLYSCEIRLSSFVHTETGLLVCETANFGKSMDYVPFYKNYVTMPPVGVLLDLPKPKVNVNSISKPCISTYFPVSTFVNTHYIYCYPKKVYASLYCRNSCSQIKKRRATLDLDEIVPVVEEAEQQHIDTRRISRARYASEGDVLILDPLLLEIAPRVNRIKTHLTESEQNKIARVTITYILAFFALVLTTFFIVYLA